MILTRDNILRFVGDKKAVTPTMIAESFETTTMIASAALSELAKDKLIGITKLKLASSPYYYDLKQKAYLMELGDKHLSKGEKDIFLKLKQKEIISDNSLTIQEKISIENIKDFAIPLTLVHDDKEMMFWVWYMRDLNETRKQINDALKPEKTPNIVKNNSSEKNKTMPNTVKKEVPRPSPVREVAQAQKTISEYRGENRYYDENSRYEKNNDSHNVNKNGYSNRENYQNQDRNNEYNSNRNPQREERNMSSPKPTITSEEAQIENFIEGFFKSNYLKIENKNKDDKGILYQTSLQINKLCFQVDCFYFYKKTNEAELLKFYTSSLKPKIVFIVNCPKKLLKLSESIENLKIINI